MPDVENLTKERSTIDSEECKGCGLCVEACTPKVLQPRRASEPLRLSPGESMRPGCTGCGLCFFACPEPGAITVFSGADGR